MQTSHNTTIKPLFRLDSYKNHYVQYCLVTAFTEYKVQHRID